MKKNAVKESSTTDVNKRRLFLKSSAAAASALILGNVLPAHAENSDDQQATETLFLFVQNANNITVEKESLRLSGVGHSTVFFSDRPARIAGHMLTSDFVEDWQKGLGKESFKQDPPNASVSIFSNDEVHDVVMTLTNPRLVGDELHYDINMLSKDVPSLSGPGSLFIDPVGRPLTPVSVAGVHRRRVRRAEVRR